ncbi:MAG: hypothetical protein PHO75_01765 [Candidatus Shapirobacteria bacterium]|nr:hypothetical protein [Candidatus Shapirobacteria bacterium]
MRISEKIAATTIAVALTLGSAGCNNKPESTPTSSSSSMDPSGEKSSTDSKSSSDFISGLESSNPVSGSNPEITKAPTPEATKVPTPTESPEELALQEKLALAPEIAGLKKEIKLINDLKRVVYISESGNPYNIEAGEYAGEYKKEVIFENQEVGGVALIPVVAEKLLRDKLASITNEADKWVAIIPADISELKTNKPKIDVNIIDFFNGQETFKDIFLKIDINENVSISCPILGNEIVNTTGSLSPTPFGLNNSFNINHFNFADIHNQFLYFTNFSTSPVIDEGRISFGAKIAEMATSIAFFKFNDSALPFNKDHILMADDSLVFLIDK